MITFGNWIHKNRIKILIVLSLLMVLVASVCRIPGLIDHPQFTTPIDGIWVKDQLELKKILWAYNAFFIIDFVWALLLLYTIYYFVKNNNNASNWFKVYIVIVCLAYIADVTENFTYLFYRYYPETIAYIKIGLYAVVFITFIILILKKYFYRYNKTAAKFVVSSVYSLIIIFLLGFLLPKTSQVNSIVVNLYNDPSNLIVLLLAFAPIYSVMLAHYPSYFNINEKFRKWYRSEYYWGLISTVFYRRNKDYKGEINKVQEGDLNFLFRILGILFYVALFYFIAFTSETNFEWGISTSGIAVTLLVSGIYLLYFLRKKKSEWYQLNYTFLLDRIPFSDGDYSDDSNKDNNETDLKDEENEKTHDQIRAERLKTNKNRLENAKQPIKEDATKNLRTILPSIKAYLWILVLIFISHIMLIGYFVYLSKTGCTDCYYSRVPVYLSLICIILQMVAYIYYRSLRSVLKFVFYSETNTIVKNAFYVLRVIKVYSKEEEDLKEEIELEEEEVQLTEEHINLKQAQLSAFFKENPFGTFSGILKFFSNYKDGVFKIKYLSIGALSNDILFLQFTIFFGIVNTLFFLIINFWNALSFRFNAALIILSALFLYYGILVVITKNFIFYKYSKEKDAVKNRKKFKFYIVMVFFILLIFNRLGRIFPNELFTLNTVPRVVQAELSLKSYVDSLPKNQTRYYIGAYGGGMKSNAWTLSVLNTLKKTDTKFLEKAVVISGASGGTMGLINWSAILNCDVESNWQNAITNISTQRVLSLDLTHILGRDTFNHLFVPGIPGLWNLSGKDRSTHAMHRYATLADNTKEVVNSIPYRQYWKDLYDSKNKQFPILISNTTNVLGNQGMAVSVRVKENTPEYSLLYQGADNILDLKAIDYDKNNGLPKITNVTLPYYNAASTSNRFPLISPAAKIESLGHFNDGGIYDNSGLLSTFKLFKSINKLDTIEHLDNLKQRNVFINIVNDKNLYIRKVVEDSLKALSVMVKEINKNTEINAILSSIASTEMMPIYIKKELEYLDQHNKNIDYKTIYLPHTFTMTDIKKIYGKVIELGNGEHETYKLLYDCVVKNDKKIDDLLKSACDYNKTRIIEPPMSRVISKDAYLFMRAMLSEKSDVYKEIVEIGGI